MSIATKRGDGGQTGLAGGIRVSKASLRVDAYGTVDELNSILGVARSQCENTPPPGPDQADSARTVSNWFGDGYAARKPQAASPDPRRNGGGTHASGARDGSDRGPAFRLVLARRTPQAAAYDVARTVCRRAERCTVRLIESGEAVNPNILAYLNRLSDLLWLFARKIEVDSGVANSLREMNNKSGPKWLRAS